MKLSLIGVTSVSALVATWRANRRAGEHLEARGRQRDVAPLRRLFAILEIAVKGALARVEIDPRDAPALTRQRDREMHGAGRFARPALFIGKDDTVRCGRRR